MSKGFDLGDIMKQAQEMQEKFASIQEQAAGRTAEASAGGGMVTAVVNGRVSAIVIDDDAQGRMMEGLLALQMHVGQPFRLEFKNIYLKVLP